LSSAALAALDAEARVAEATLVPETLQPIEKTNKNPWTPGLHLHRKPSLPEHDIVMQSKDHTPALLPPISQATNEYQ
jgi:hypothetical protein